MQEIKKQLELLLVNYFRDCFPAFPKGKLVPSESPDFVLRSKYGKKIGIELVRLHPDIPYSSLAEGEKSAFRFELIEEARELFERTSSLKLFVKFQFSEKKNIPPERLLSLSVLAANLIRKAVANRNDKSFFYHLFPTVELPKGLKQILIVHHPELSESVWEEANNLGISENVVSDLHLVIQKKEEKYQLYQKQKLDDYWLLITSDRLRNTRNSNVDNRIFKEEFHSAFGSILLFDLLKAKIHELKMPSL